MAIILQIETATSMCSVAVSADGVTASCVETNEPNIHAEQLLPMIEEALEKSGQNYKTLSAVAVSKGPGIIYRIENWSGKCKRTLLRIKDPFDISTHLTSHLLNCLLTSKMDIRSQNALICTQ